MTDIQREEIGRLIREGYTSGRIDSDGEQVAWELKVNILKDEEVK